MTTQTSKPATSKRELLKQQNQLTLITATLDCIADIGVTQTSVTEIVQRAGLSRGMIHLHFSSKDGLLVAAGEYASQLYYSNLSQLLEQTHGSPQKVIETVIRSDLSQQVLNQHSANIWYAFRGEARYFKEIAHFSDTRDKRLRDIVLQAFLQLAQQAAQQQESDNQAQCDLAKEATYGTLALMEGMWTDYLLHADSFNRDKAVRIVLRFLSALFPKSFDLNGAL